MTFWRRNVELWRLHIVTCLQDGDVFSFLAAGHDTFAATILTTGNEHAALSEYRLPLIYDRGCSQEVVVPHLGPATHLRCARFHLGSVETVSFQEPWCHSTLDYLYARAAAFPRLARKAEPSWPRRPSATLCAAFGVTCPTCSRDPGPLLPRLRSIANLGHSVFFEFDWCGSDAEGSSAEEASNCSDEWGDWPRGAPSLVSWLAVVLPQAPRLEALHIDKIYDVCSEKLLELDSEQPDDLDLAELLRALEKCPPSHLATTDLPELFARSGLGLRARRALPALGA